MYSSHKSSMTSLYESIFDDDIVTRKADPDEYIKNFLRENYHIDLNSITITEDKYNPGNYIVDAPDDVYVKNSRIQSLTDKWFKFGKIKGKFYCPNCRNLKSLEGAPEEVRGEFSCRNCINLENLKGAPEKVGGDFDWDNGMTEISKK